MKKKPNNLMSVFVTAFVITGVFVGGFALIADEEGALLFALTWLAATVAVAGAGIENTINQKD